MTIFEGSNLNFFKYMARGVKFGRWGLLFLVTNKSLVQLGSLLRSLMFFTSHTTFFFLHRCCFTSRDVCHDSRARECPSTIIRDALHGGQMVESDEGGRMKKSFGTVKGKEASRTNAPCREPTCRCQTFVGS